jgi:CrcB protein
MMTIAFIAAAALGGVLRLWAESYWPPVGPSAYPRATLIVNSVGSFALGLVVHAPNDVRLILGTALCGALTTLSGVSLQLYRRVIAGGSGPAAVYLLSTLGAGLLCAFIGIEISQRIF